MILGSTGSIGTQALDLVRAHPDRFRVVGLTAGGSNPELFEAQVAEFAPAYSGLGEEASTEAAGRPCDVVLNGITGAVGLRPTLAALDAGTTLALANKESLIIGGPLVKERARPGQIVPVDSEHSAIAQSLRAGSAEEVRRLVLTASGGPFRGRTRRGARRRHPGAGARAPQLRDGPGDHHQLRDAGQQGPRGHRGAPALRHPLRPHRRRRPPAAAHPLDGRVRRRRGGGPARPAHHAGPDLPRAWAGPTASPTPRRRSTGPGPRTGASSPSTTWSSPPSPWPGPRGSAAAPRPPSTTPPTRSCVDAFHDGRLRFPDIVSTVAHVLDRHDVPSKEHLTVDDVLAADSWARAEAAALI